MWIYLSSLLIFTESAQIEQKFTRITKYSIKIDSKPLGIISDENKAQIFNSRFSNIQNFDTGAAMYSIIHLNVANCEFTKISSRYGAIYCSKTLIIEETMFNNCESNQSACIRVESRIKSQNKIDLTSFTSIKSKEFGAIYHNSYSSLDLTNSNASNTESQLNVGFLFLCNGCFYTLHCRFIKTSSKANGCLFIYNSTQYLSYSCLFHHISHLAFNRNTGTAIYIDISPDSRIIKCSFTELYFHLGSIIYVDYNSRCTIYKCCFSEANRNVNFITELDNRYSQKLCELPMQTYQRTHVESLNNNRKKLISLCLSIINTCVFYFIYCCIKRFRIPDMHVRDQYERLPTAIQ